MPSKYQTKEARFKVLHGYPKDFVFETPEQLRDYFAGDRIVCLRCGKSYRTLGIHLNTIHDLTPDEYREMYGIPWGKGLSCAETTEKHSTLALKMIDDGIIKPITGEQFQKLISTSTTKRKRQPVRDVLTARNLAKMNEGKTGEDAMKRLAAPKRGSEEDLKNRANSAKERPTSKGFSHYWLGKKQSTEHVQKRMSYRKKKATTEVGQNQF